MERLNWIFTSAHHTTKLIVLVLWHKDVAQPLQEFQSFQSAIKANCHSIFCV